jgi:hypothetical protein
MGSFQYKNGSTWTDIPDAAKPDNEGGSIVVVYPEPQARDGNGNPCGAIGQPHISIRFSRMLGSGMAFWQGLFPNATALSVAVSVTAFDPRTGAWVKYAGTLLRPTSGTVQARTSGGQTWFREGEIVIDAITVTT